MSTTATPTKRSLLDDFDAVATPEGQRVNRTMPGAPSKKQRLLIGDEDVKLAAHGDSQALQRCKNSIMQYEANLRDNIIDGFSVGGAIFTPSSVLYVMPHPSPAFLTFKELALAVQFLSDNSQKNLCVVSSLGSSFSSLECNFLIFALMDKDQAVVDVTRWLFQYMALAQLRVWRSTGNTTTVVHLPDTPVPEYLIAAVLLGHRTWSQLGNLAYALLYCNGYISAVLHLYRETHPFVAEVFLIGSDPHGTRLKWNESVSSVKRELLTIDLRPVNIQIDTPILPSPWKCACCGSDDHQTPPV